MPMIQPGNAGYILHSIDSDFDPTFGARNTLSYSGIFSKIDALYDSYVAIGARVSAQNLGLKWTLRVTVGAEYTPITPPTDPTTIPVLAGPEAPSVSYFISSGDEGRAIKSALAEVRQKLLSIKGDVEAQLGVFGDGGNDDYIAGVESLIHSYRSETSKTTRQANYDALAITALQPEEQYLQQLFRAQDARLKATRKWPILRRVRTYSINFTDPVVLNENETVRTTSRLITDFALPAFIANQLPANPDNSTQDSAYGWKEVQNDRAYIPGHNRFEETISWQFKDWSVLTVQLLA